MNELVTSTGAPVRRSRRPFTPSQESAAELSARTVGRDELVELVVNRVRRAATSATRAHTLFVGPRGSGKTHLVEVVLHRALADPAVADQVVVARADEDAVGLTRHEDLLDIALGALGQPTGNHNDQSRESRIGAALRGRVLVLVLENLDRLFDAMGLEGQRALRAWVETSGDVLLLATSPLLFPAIAKRSEPWYGGLAISHVPDLSVDDGRELLRRMAAESGDAKLAEFLATDTAVNRLRAIDALAGGSPRVWMILSECLTVESLDELAPAVEDLLEGLVPYYQQLLWDLAPNEQRVVRALAAGSSAGMTVGEIADAAGVDVGVTGTTLRRLADAKWVAAAKQPGLDQRTTWYRLREPLLRHHFQYRGSRRDEPLLIIVEILRAWYDPSERRRHLAHVPLGSAAERLILGSMGGEVHRFDSAYAERDVDELLADARRWIAGEDADRRTREAGALVEVAVLAAQYGRAAATDAISSRHLTGDVARVARHIATMTSTDDRGPDLAERVGGHLAAAASSTEGRTHTVLEFVSASWDASRDPRQARDRLSALRSVVGGHNPDPLDLDIAQELASWIGTAGDAATARDQLTTLLPVRERILGAEHPDTLATRHELAVWTGAAGDAVAAQDQLVDLLVVQERVLGAEDPSTLVTRHNLAVLASEVGDASVARDQFAVLLPLRERALGAEHPDTLVTKHYLACLTGEAGDAASARDQLAELIPVSARVLGTEHPMVLSALHNLASWTAQVGDVAAARDQYEKLLPVLARVLGARHPGTLMTRHNLAVSTEKSGDASRAVHLAAALLADLVEWGDDGRLLASTRAVLRSSVAQLLGRGRSAEASRVGPAVELASAFEAALAGSPEALARLPSELAVVARDVRTAQGRGVVR